MASYLYPPLPADQVAALSTTATAELAALDFLHSDALGNAATAYAVAKQANKIHVQRASLTWGQRGARVNSISPGVIATAMGHQELSGPSGQAMRSMIASSGTGRIGTATDIADAAAFLLGPTATFITGTDLLVDGGTVAAISSH